MSGSVVDADYDVSIDVVTVTGRAATVELRIRDDGVEIWHHAQLAAVFDRGLLHGWLQRPDRSLMVGDVLFTLDRSVDVHGRAAIRLDDTRHRVILSLRDVRSWALSDSEVETLRRRI